MAVGNFATAIAKCQNDGTQPEDDERDAGDHQASASGNASARRSTSIVLRETHSVVCSPLQRPIIEQPERQRAGVHRHGAITGHRARPFAHVEGGI